MGMKFDLITDNPFRILSIGANADSAQIDDAIDYILDEISLFGGEGQALDYDLAGFSVPDRSAENISKYQQMLQQDADYYRMFWFVEQGYTKTWNEFSDINERLNLISQGPNAGNYDAFLSVVLFAAGNIQNDSVISYVWPRIFYYLNAMSNENVLASVFGNRCANPQIEVLKRGHADLKKACTQALTDISQLDWILKGYTTWNEDEVIKELKEEIISSFIAQLTQICNAFLDDNIAIESPSEKSVETQRYEYGLYHVVNYLDKLNRTFDNKQIRQILVQANAKLACIMYDLDDMGKVQEKNDLLEKARQAGASAYHIRIVNEAYEKEDWNLLAEHVRVGIHAGHAGCLSKYLYYLREILGDPDQAIEVGIRYLEEHKKVAAYMLGNTYDAKQDYAKAEYYWKMALDEGDADAAVQIAMMYEMKDVHAKYRLPFSESSKYVLKYYATAMHLAPNNDGCFDEYNIHQIRERSKKGIAWIAACYRHMELYGTNSNAKVLTWLNEKYIQYNPNTRTYKIDGERARADGRSMMSAVAFAEDAFWASIYDFSIMAQKIPEGINRLMQNPSGNEMKDMLRLAYMYTCKSMVHVQDIKTDLDDCERIFQYLKRVDELDDGSDSWLSRMLLKWKDDVEDRIALLKELILLTNQHPEEAPFVILEYCDYACNPKNSPVRVDVCESVDLYKKISVCTGFDEEEMKQRYSKVYNYKNLAAFKEYIQNRDLTALMQKVLPNLRAVYSDLEFYDGSDDEMNQRVQTIIDNVHKWNKNIIDNMDRHERDYPGQPDEELKVILLNDWIITDVEPVIIDLLDNGLWVDELITLLHIILDEIAHDAYICYQEAYCNKNPKYEGSARNLDRIADGGSRLLKYSILISKYFALGDDESIIKLTEYHSILAYSDCVNAYIASMMRLGRDWEKLFRICTNFVEKAPAMLNYCLAMAARELGKDWIPYALESIKAGNDHKKTLLPMLSKEYRSQGDWSSAIIYAATYMLHFPDDPDAYNDDVLNLIRSYSPSTIEWVAAAYRQVVLTRPQQETYATYLLRSEGVYYDYNTGSFSAEPSSFYKLIQSEIFDFAFLTEESDKVINFYSEKLTQKEYDVCQKGFYVSERSMFAVYRGLEEDFSICCNAWMWLLLYETSGLDAQHLDFVYSWQDILKRRIAKMWELINIKLLDRERCYRETIEFYQNVRCMFGKDIGINTLQSKIDFYEACLNGTKSENLTGYEEFIEGNRYVVNDILQYIP